VICMANRRDEIWENPKAFRQQVTLARVQVEALGEEDLASALAYEVEPFSGIVASQAEVAWRVVEDAGGKDVVAFDVAVARQWKSTSKGKKARSVWMWLGAVMALLAVGADWACLKHEAAVLREAVAEQEPLDAQIRQIRDNAAKVRQSARQLKGSREKLAEAQDDIEAMRSAYPKLMDAIASACRGRTVVKSFTSTGPFEVEMNAVAASAQSCSDVMAALSRIAPEKGWKLAAGEIASSEQGTTAKFSCKLAFAAHGEEAAQ